MTALFESILFARRDRVPEPTQAPACFCDLRLDQVVERVTAGRDEYQLAPLYRRPLDDLDADPLSASGPVRSAPAGDRRPDRHVRGRMREVRKYLALAAKLHYPLQSQRWQLEAASVYCDAVGPLSQQLNGAEPQSSGFAGAARLPGRLRAVDCHSPRSPTRPANVRARSPRFATRVHLHGARVRVDTIRT